VKDHHFKGCLWQYHSKLHGQKDLWYWSQLQLKIIIFSFISNLSKKLSFLWCPRGNHIKLFYSRFCVFNCKECLLKGKDQYSWPPCTNQFRSTAFHTETISKQPILKRRLTVLSHPLRYGFPGTTIRSPPSLTFESISEPLSPYQTPVCRQAPMFIER
jgi:hypothetical protein